jgi:hypothetical protein
MAELVFLEGERFERAPFDLAGGAEPPGQIVGDTEGDFHLGDPTYAQANVHISF